MTIRYLIGLILLLWLAFALRLFQLGGQSIWWDEGISLHLATSGFEEIVQDRLNNIHPPLFFFTLKVWLEGVGYTVFTARYLALLGGWLQVAAIFAVARRWFGVQTAAIAGILAAVSAVSIIYSQEIRVYSLLPLVYLALLAVTRELTRPIQGKKGEATSLWVFLGLVTWIGLHLHYITFFVVIYVSIWALIVFIKRQRWLQVRLWFLVQFLVLLASLPWFMPVIRNIKNVNAEANAGTYVADPIPLQFLFKQVWAFHLTGLGGMLSRRGSLELVALIVVGLILLFILRLTQKSTRIDAAVLLAHWLVPLSSALLVWTVRSFSHPRYVAIFVPGLIILVAFLILPPSEGEKFNRKKIAGVLSTLLFLGIVIASLWGLNLYFFDPDVAKDDMRGIAQYLESMTSAEDLILVPDTDYSLPFEYHGEARIAMPHLFEPDEGWSYMQELTADVQRIFVVEYLDGNRDWQNRLPFSLAKAGSQVAERRFDGLVVRTYDLDEPISAPHITAGPIDIGPLTLNGAWIEQDSKAGDKLAVALSWQLRMDADESVNAALRLFDESDWTIASDDTLLRDLNGRPTSQWEVGLPVTTYHTIPVPPAIPPLAYEVGIQLYIDSEGGIQPLDVLDKQGAPQGHEKGIGFAHLAKALGNEAISWDNLPLIPDDEPVDLLPGLSLLAAKVQEGTFTPGDLVDVHLLWQAKQNLLEEIEPEIVLAMGNNELFVDGGNPVNGRYPTSMWEPGEIVYEHRYLKIPPEVSGLAHISIRFGDREIKIGELQISEIAHIFESPIIKNPLDRQLGEIALLKGFELPQRTFTVDENVSVALLWQSIVDGSEIDYVVFAHLLGEDGVLIGQHDTPPAKGTRRTTGWVQGEFVLDMHEMTLKEAYRGEATIEIGMYDPISGSRLLFADGSDHFILPVTIEFNP